MLAYSEAIAKVLETIWPLPPVEESLQEVRCGQILAETVHACHDLPPAATSTMDGFAFAHSSLNGQTPLQIAGFVPAGGNFKRLLGAAETVRIMTGAPLPEGCDTVVPLEEAEQKDNKLKLTTVPNLGDYVRQCGEDFRQADQILAAGIKLDPGAAGLLSAAGISRLKVYPRPKVAILSTGDELVALDEAPPSGKIINSNVYMLAARLQEEGIDPLLLGIAGDCIESLEDKLKQGLASDLLITTGGVSVGDRDLTQAALNKLGFSEVFWKVAISPGRPVLFGMIGTLPVFCLPGNPSATATTFELFVRPALRRLSGFCNPLTPQIKVQLAVSVTGGKKYQKFLWGQLKIVRGNLQFHPAKSRKSGQLSDLLGAHALLPVAIDSPALPAGSEVEVILLRLPDSDSI